VPVALVGECSIPVVEKVVGSPVVVAAGESLIAVGRKKPPSAQLHDRQERDTVRSAYSGICLI
jgi:hypothetical protein